MMDFVLDIQRAFGNETIIELMEATTNEGYNVLNVISRYQNENVINGTLQFLDKRDRSEIKKILLQKDKSGQNIGQIMFEYNIDSLTPVLKSFNEFFSQTEIFEKLICDPNNNKDMLCHLLILKCPDLFLDILQIKMLDLNLMEKIFFEPGANNDMVIDKLCGDIECFTVTFSRIKNTYGLGVTESLLFNGEENQNPVLSKILQKNELDEAKKYLKWMLDELKELFTMMWLQKIRNTEENPEIYFSKESDKKYFELSAWSCESTYTKVVETIDEDRSASNWQTLHFYSSIMNETCFNNLLKQLFEKPDKKLAGQFLLNQMPDGF